MPDSTFIGLDVHKATISVAVGLCCTNRVENVLQMDLAYGLNDRYAEGIVRLLMLLRFTHSACG